MKLHLFHEIIGPNRLFGRRCQRRITAHLQESSMTQKDYATLSTLSTHFHDRSSPIASNVGILNLHCRTKYITILFHVVSLVPK